MSNPIGQALPAQRQRVRTGKRNSDPVPTQGGQSLLLRVLVYGAAIFTFAVLMFLIGYILIRGIPYLTLDLFSMEYTSENCSMMPAVITTIEITVLSLLIAIPISIFTAVYLVEYAKKGSKLVGLMRLTAETLSGIPSIVYGLFGMLFFVTQLGWRLSVLSGALTLAIMILPLIMRSTEEALLSVPDMYREASFGLGAGKLRTVFRIVIPSAMPGILAGIILAMGRVVGETAALMYTAGTATDIPLNPLQSGRTLAVHMYSLSREGLHTNQAYATAVVLLLIVLAMNTISALIARRLAKK